MNIFKNITPDDPRLTAYALGELSDAAEKSAIEQAVAADSQLAAAVDEIRATAELLGSAFVEDVAQGEPYSDPSATASSSTAATAASAPIKGTILKFIGAHTVELASAASIAVILTCIFLPEPTPIREVGQMPARPVETVSLAEFESTPTMPEPEVALDSYVPPATREPVPVLRNNEIVLREEKRSLLEVESSPAPESVFADGSEIASVSSNDFLVTDKRDADALATDEILPAPRPKVRFQQAPIQVAAEEVGYSTQSVTVMKPSKDGAVTVSGGAGYESQYVYRGKVQAGPSMQSGVGLSFKPGATEADTPVEANVSTRYDQPGEGGHYTGTITAPVGANTDESKSKENLYAFAATPIAGKPSDFKAREPELPVGGDIATPPAAPVATAPVAEGRIEAGKKLEQSQMNGTSVGFFGIVSREETPEEAAAAGRARSGASRLTKESFSANLQQPARPSAQPVASTTTATNGNMELQEVSRSWQRPQLYPSEPVTPLPQPAPEYRDQRQPSNTEGYLPVTDNAFKSPLSDPLSTFSIDVDTASYANVRRFIDQGQLPPPDAVRIEELVNYFPYDYPAPGPEAEHPLACYVDAAPAPWAPEHRLVRVAMKAQDIAWEDRPPSNLVFLVDVSGSMNRPNKLPLVKDALAKLIRRLDGRDRVAIVVYAGSSGLVLPSTTANNAETIQYALDNLRAGGSTNGGEGLLLAYKIAKDNLLEEGNNRVILCTDGDFNVGVSDKGQIATLAEVRAKDGIYLTVLGFGMGNLKDDMLETLSNRGNGNYAYIDSEKEARKVFVEQAAGTLLTVAKDVKIQVEFNPAAVQSYRLIGYENRILAARDFNDDTKDAGEVGAGHSVTALYEVVPVGVKAPSASAESVTGIDPLKYQGGDDRVTGDVASEVDAELPSEMLTVKMRYKLPDSDTSTKVEFVLSTDDALTATFEDAPADFRFAAAVAEFGMVLRHSPYKGTSSLTGARNIAEGALGTDSGGHRGDFVDLAEKAIRQKGETPATPDGDD